MSNSPGNMVHTTAVTQHRFHTLDAMRGVAALLVVLYHAPADFGRVMPFRSGFLAVDLFFVLSGFVIAFSYERRLLEGLSFHNFVIARMIRLYPVYILGTLFGLAAALIAARSLYQHGSLSTALPGLLLMPNLLHGRAAALYPLNFPAWSLLCELLANFGYAALLIGKVAGRWALYLVIAASAVFMLVCARRAGTLDSGSVLQSFPMGLARVGFSFGAGVIVFRCFRSQSHPRVTGSNSLLLFSGVMLAIVAALATRVTQPVAAQLLAVFVVFPALIYFGAMTSIAGKLSRIAAFLGDVSYPLYLFHIPFFTLFRGRTMHRIAVAHARAMPLLAFLSIAFLVWLSWAAAKWFDLPVRRYLAARYNRSHAVQRTPEMSAA